MDGFWFDLFRPLSFLSAKSPASKIGTGSDRDKLLKAEQLTRVGPSFLVLTGCFLASFLAARDFRFVHAVAHAKG